jgi:hypothetical protein
VTEIERGVGGRKGEKENQGKELINEAENKMKRQGSNMSSVN